ncbi:MAG: riboflavin synthase, partial [Verrucomicrobiota bacterium]|nr:riboflavin synthase [Verrucomicrobiota bacterium]
MFTGLVEKTGSVSTLQATENGAKIIIDIPFSEELSIGDSIAVNGCCLTVSTIDEEKASFDLLAQTLKVTALKELKPGMIVNLERALIAGHRIGGHFLTGHIDTVSEIITYEPIGADHKLEIFLPRNMAHLVIAKGSISVDGISLTIA